MANTDKNRNRIIKEDKMKPTRTLIPVLTLAAGTILIAQNNPGQPEPFPAPGDPLPTAPVPAKPAPVPAKPAPVPAKPAPSTITIPAPIAIAPAAPATKAPTPEARQQPIVDPSIGLGIVNGTRVSARGKATIFSELVFQFQKDEALNILEEITLDNPKAGEPRKWYRVQVPIDAGLWVHGDFLHAATTIQGLNAQNQPIKLNVASIKANVLNVRGGAGEQFPILSKLPREAQVVLTGASKGKWREVLAPENASVYVAAQFVTRQKITSGVVEVPQPAIPTPAVTPPATNPAVTPPATNPALPLQPTQPATNVTPDQIKDASSNKKSNLPAASKPTAPTSTPEVKPVVTTPEVKPVVTTKVNPVLPTSAATKPNSNTPARIIHREGIIRRTLDIQSPSGYVLEHLDSGKKINYLVLDEAAPLKLKWFLGKKVSVSGEEAMDVRKSKTPVLLINTLKGKLNKEFLPKISSARIEAVKKEKSETSGEQPPTTLKPNKTSQEKKETEGK